MGSPGNLRGTLGTLIFIISWTCPLLLVPLSILLMTLGHGVLAVCAGFVLIGIMMGGPDTALHRGGVHLVYLALAVTVPAHWRLRAATGWLLLGGIVCMVTDSDPLAPKSVGQSPAFCRLIKEGLPPSSYFAATELGGCLEGIKPGKNLFAVHPHGTLTHGWTWNLVWNFDLHERTGRIGFLIDTNLRLMSPVFRILVDFFENEKRYALPATKYQIMKAMERGDSLGLLPGGFQEACLTRFGKDRVYIKKRQGFIKYCLQHGYRVTPVYTFGESDTYYTFAPLLGLRMWLGSFNIPAVLAFGRWFFPLLPFKESRLLTFVGPPLELPKIEAPSAEDVAKWHGKYVEALQGVFDKHKAEAGRPDAVLEIY